MIIASCLIYPGQIYGLFFFIQNLSIYLRGKLLIKQSAIVYLKHILENPLYVSANFSNYVPLP